MKIGDTVDLAKEYASNYHAGQMWGEHPYMYHLIAVAGTAERFMTPTNIEWLYPERPFFRQHIKTLCYLHDVIEDTSATKENVQEVFGKLVAFDVDSLTDAEGANRKERKRKTWHKIRRANSTIFVKLCDRLVNTPGKMQSMYAKEFPLFEAALYTPGQFEDMWEELQRLTFT